VQEQGATDPRPWVEAVSAALASDDVSLVELVAAGAAAELDSATPVEQHGIRCSAETDVSSLADFAEWVHDLLVRPVHWMSRDELARLLEDVSRVIGT